MKNFLFVTVMVCVSVMPAFSQVNINKPINLNSANDGERIITNMANPLGGTDGVNTTNLQSGRLVYADATNSGASFVVTLPVTPAAYTTGMIINFKASAISAPANGTARTLLVTGLTAKAIMKNVNVPVTQGSGDILADQLVSVIYDGTNFQLLSRGNTAGTVTSVDVALPASVFSVSGGPVTGSGTITGTLASQTTNKVLAAPDGSTGTPTFRALAAGDIPSLDAGKITTGTFATGRIPSLDASIITSGTFNAARIPSLDASKIGSGILGMTYGGTGVSSLSGGSVPFIAGGVFAQNNAQLFWNNSTLRLGVGIDDPQSKLNVAGGLSLGTGAGISTTHGARRSIQILTDNTYGGACDAHSGALLYSTMICNWTYGELNIAISDNWGSYNTGAPALKITQRGIYAASSYYASDKRLKSDFETITYGLNDIMKLNPLSYTQYRSELKDGRVIRQEEGKKSYGFIAQDLYKIVPEAVSKPMDETKDFWAVDYARLTPILVKAIQEQETKIETLEKQNAELKAANAEIIKTMQTQIDLIKEQLNTKSTK